VGVIDNTLTEVSDNAPTVKQRYAIQTSGAAFTTGHRDPGLVLGAYGPRRVTANLQLIRQARWLLSEFSSAMDAPFCRHRSRADEQRLLPAIKDHRKRGSALTAN